MLNSFVPCRTQQAGLNTRVVFNNISLSTVMRCEGKQKCSLHLRVHTALQLSEHIHGVSICTVTTGMMLESCRLVSFPRVARERLEEQQVEVQNDCSEVWPAGRLAYTVDSDRKELAVSVSDMLEDEDYHLRLCHRKAYTCRDTGANTLIVSALLLTVPLLFSKGLEELWSGINFDPVEEALSWEPVCPVAVVISLCQKRGDDECDDLAGSSQTLSREKFTTDSGSWIRCPFADGNFQAWDLGVDQLRLVVTSRVRAPISLRVCVKTGTSVCHPGHTFPVHGEKSVNLNLTVDICLPNTCVQVKRLNVKYAATILHCYIRCLDQTDACGHAPAMVGQTPAMQGYLELTWVVVPAVACLTAAVIVAALVVKVLLTVHQKRHRKGRDGVCTLKRQTGLQEQSTFHKEIPMPDTLQFENCERDNLLQF
ncbi:unnamed protein product [Coregonus sp. 'balchen']|nr:unnamed protein product [Coregonus sp. 'balchen']